MFISAWWGGAAQGLLLKHHPVRGAMGRLGAEILNLVGLVQAEKFLEQLFISQMYKAVGGRTW